MKDICRAHQPVRWRVKRIEIEQLHRYRSTGGKVACFVIAKLAPEPSERHERSLLLERVIGLSTNIHIAIEINVVGLSAQVGQVPPFDDNGHSFTSGL